MYRNIWNDISVLKALRFYVMSVISS